MIPIQLTIQGLYSYQKKQTIDFTHLTNAGLFGIFGTTGSGKSTILEAIIYALYGRTSRFNLAGDNRYYNMMNLKSEVLFIDFTFCAGKDQSMYKSLVKGKRNSKNFDDVKTLERNAYKKSGSEWVPIELTELEKSVGLSYDNFRRTIIIPQGQFQEFLQLGNKDRTVMMKELFNLAKFEFSGKVTSLEIKNNSLIQNIEGQLKQVGDIDENQIIHYQQQLALFQNELLELNNKLKNYRLKVEQLNALQALMHQSSTTENELNTLLNQEPAFRKLENSIAEFELCTRHFKHLIGSLNDCETRQKQKENLIQKERAKLKMLNHSIATDEQKLADILPEYEKRNSLKLHAQDLMLIIKIKSLQETINTNRARLSKGTSIFEDTKKDIADLTTEKLTLESVVKNLKQNLPDMSILIKAMEWHKEKSVLDNQKNEIEAQISKDAKEAEHLNQQFLKYLDEPEFAHFNDTKSVDKALEYLNAKYIEFQQKEKLLETEGGELGVKAQLLKFAIELNDGKACPLCGSTHHPDLYTSESLHEAQVKHQQLKEESRCSINRIQDFRIQLSNLQIKLAATENKLQEWRQKFKAKAAETARHIALFEWEKYRTTEALKNDFIKAKEVQADITAKEEKLGTLQQQLEKIQLRKDKFQAELDHIVHLITVSETEARTLQEQLMVADAEKYKDASTSEISAEKDRLLVRFTQLENTYDVLNKRLIDKRQDVHSATGSVLALDNDLMLEKQTHIQLSDQLNTALQRYNYTSIDAVRDILDQPIDVEKDKKRLTDYNEQKSLLKERLSRLKIDINNRIYEPEEHNRLTLKVGNIQEAIDEKNRQVGMLSEQIKKLQEGLKQKTLLTTELEKLNLRAANIKTMKQLFKAGGFVNYISSVYLQNLCNSANERFFQLTRQKLSLEITSDNNFQVRDYLNGGKVRSVKTLSGGQTFQAALSLALALADNIQKVTESDQNFFFLDEGFGSLDGDSLSVVFDTLKTLRKENRIVGVISHVEEMQQEIDVHLKIINHEEQGSIIYSSQQS